MGKWIFFGSFCAVILGVFLIYSRVRSKIRQFSRQAFGTAELLEGLRTADSEDTPRSLNGCDSLLQPRILADFPDFDFNLAKTYVRKALADKCAGMQDFTIYKVVIARYLSSQAQKTIVYQAAASRMEGGRKKQLRFEMDYTYLLGGSSVAANCPNCGGALGFGITQCPYCNSRVANALGNTWQFTQIRET